MWTSTELGAIATADDLHIAPYREDGKTYGTLTWIWSVVVDGALYVRAYNGTKSRWHKAAIRQKAGRITVAGLTRDVVFEPVEASAAVDDAYCRKFAKSPYLAPMIGTQARGATIKITPRD